VTFKLEHTVWVVDGRRRDRIGQSGVVKHVDDQRGRPLNKLMVWVKFEDRAQSICFNANDLSNKSPLEWLAEQSE
jgi:hypothetical protein